MKKYIYSILVLFLSMQITSCSDNTLEELSVDPNNPVKVTPTLLLTASQVSILGQFGYGWDRYAGAFVQTFAGNHAIGVQADQYDLQPTDFQGDYTAFYRVGGKDCYDIINTQGPAAGADHHVGVAKILMAIGLGYLTDVYGDIPYTEAWQINEFKNAKFDSQQDIYTTINTLLTGAIADLQKTPTLPLSGDLVHGNNPQKWIATAYMLLARYENHLSGVDAAGSATRALAYVDQAKAAGLTSSAGDLTMKFDDQDPNWRNPWLNLFENNLIIASSNFMGYLIGSAYGSWDPRLFAYWNTNSFGAGSPFVDFTGKDNGLPTSNVSYSPVGDQGYYGKVNSPELIAPYFELLFIEAEAALRANNPGRAATALNAAVAAQMGQVAQAGAAHAAQYFSVDLATAQGAIAARENAYIAFNTVTAGTVTMEKIMTEKYVAMFTMNLETWTDVRRHDWQFPTYLALPANAFLSTFIARGLYPQSEVENNTSTPSGVTMTDKLWWDK